MTATTELVDRSDVNRSPEEVLARLEADATSLRRRGFGVEAARLDVVAGEFRSALGPIALVPEHDALARSGKSAAWLRSRYDAWQRVGAAATIDGVRHYRLCVLPTRLEFAAGSAEADRLLRRLR